MILTMVQAASISKPLTAMAGPGRPPSGGLVKSALGRPLRSAGFRRPVEIHDAEYTDLSNGLLRAARAVGDDARSVLTGADLAFDLHVRTLGESARVAREFAEDHTAVPFRCRAALAGVAVFPDAMGRQREYGEFGLVAGGANDGVLAEISGETSSVLHVGDAPFLLPMSAGAPKSERSRSQGQELLFWVDRQGHRPFRKDGGGAETRRAAKSEAEARSFAGRG
jgi:hypothetical protein